MVGLLRQGPRFGSDSLDALSVRGETPGWGRAICLASGWFLTVAPGSMTRNVTCSCSDVLKCVGNHNRARSVVLEMTALQFSLGALSPACNVMTILVDHSVY